MTAYKVAIRRDGTRVWWASYDLASYSCHSDLRDATPEEAALMEKVVWDNHTPDDLAKLKQLLSRQDA